MSPRQSRSEHKKSDGTSIALLEKYIQRELVRPKTTWDVPLFIAMLMALLPLGVGYAACRFVFSAYPVPCYVISYLAIDLLLLRVLLIKLIRCYQHYAKEELRRFCMCMPSCSEYAIAVLKKYPLPVAIVKIILRLTVTCDGEMKIDLP